MNDIDYNELLKAAELLAVYCGDHDGNCSTCAFNEGTLEDASCALYNEEPCNWPILEEPQEIKITFLVER